MTNRETAKAYPRIFLFEELFGGFLPFFAPRAHREHRCVLSTYKIYIYSVYYANIQAFLHIFTAFVYARRTEINNFRFAIAKSEKRHYNSVTFKKKRKSSLKGE